ncbi:serine/threonine-protein kinase [Arthrobacter sp. B3I4]|uniref:serine/threonine-protein kinase n=1 Tax=Arthrobacter sp. B3I4 TaxID=3042267 RepID=UPI00278A234C|nr:serine/threonine-protein kinase [Arthrobacter sp. B3I4]MDQ0756763.1 serine/threonine protein kinase [Arthrobacter sp. B3I4]
MDDFELPALTEPAPPDPAPPDPATPPQVDGYDVGRLLGRGSSAAVWLATDRRTLRQVALKYFTVDEPDVVPPSSWGGEEAVRREVRILSALDHEHLVKAHAVVRARQATSDGEARDGLALVLDYAAGGSLAGLVAVRGRLSPGEVVTVLTPIAQVLAYLHGQGFTHGDVAPGNVVFTAQGKPLLTDLGVGRMLADPQDPLCAGTEGFRDPAPVDAVRAGLQPEADVYSAAALGWFCLTGTAPEPGPERPPLPLLVPGVPPALAEVLEAGLRTERRQRPSAAELAAAVFRSAPAAPLDLSVSVHPTVLPELLTRRSLPVTGRDRRLARLQDWRRRLAFSEARLRSRLWLRSGSAVPVRRAGPEFAGGGVAGARHAARRRASGQGRASGRGRHRTGWRRAAGVLVLAVLATAALLEAPLVFGPTGGPAARPTAGPGGAETSNPATSTPGSVAPTSGAASALPADLESLLASPRPEDAARGLAALRSYALGTGKLGLLAEVTVPASPAAAADAGIAARLASTGHVLEGFETRVSVGAPQPGSTPDRAVLPVSVVSPSYRERDGVGTVVAEADAVEEQRLRLVLVPVDGKWRLQEILPGTGG